ncbi:hypothetical protein [Mycobacteroides franklinii]|uniref:Uncharacterized protein n=1 Tax=Mycobacteroides franklinii TaxID=948102 RepID=A0A4R8R5I4_9MYCO|nr:hypothetical protein [Mycobacteroides franklinii]ORA64619.1 hypothetical protein BST24_00975 [Mycobacteroides franklinii]TDH22652.1 hypothetical protein EJ571_12185 [Mycobacteroides franklinii]TDZ44309.1 hypothetical protein CCUG64054_04374 [Mycobacteroides franklinii]TDZ51442.1 hypothetical protein CCUG63697_02958 [Mycobacteroides franklinii]TDZ57863.1 hypothetical protein CCUG63696_04370 [Mycobacteroides franklinii]
MRNVFDIRNVIAALLGIFGLILVGVGIHDASAHNLAKAGGNVNLWTGIAMTLVAAVFVAWALRQPAQTDSSDEN